MKERTFYRITKGGKTVEAKNKAEAYEAWDSFGRGDTKVEYVKIWKEHLRDTWHEDVAPVKRLSRRYVDNGRSSSYIQGSPYYAYAFSYGKNRRRVIEVDS